VLLMALADCILAADTLYHFTDERGVPHYSNQPLESRYRLLAPAGAAQSMQEAGQASAAELKMSAPEQAVLGDVFEVTLSIAQARTAAGAGYLELSFDPETLALQAISVEASITEPGKLRIEVQLDGAQPEQTLANMSFQAVAAEPTQAAIQVTQLELFSPAGEVVPVHTGVWANVQLVQ
jgi:hypothetical protein